MRKRRKYSKEFKEQAVARLSTSNESMKDIAFKLGINADNLRRWKSEVALKSKDAFPGNGKLSGTDAEIANLKKRLRDAEMERDILKKAVVIFSKH